MSNTRSLLPPPYKQVSEFKKNIKIKYNGILKTELQNFSTSRTELDCIYAVLNYEVAVVCL